MTKTYPIALSGLADKKVVVVGGGRVGTRKAQGIIETGAIVTVVSPMITDDLKQLADNGYVQIKLRHFQDDDLIGAFIVFAATDSRAINRQIATLADAQNMLCNVADAPDEGKFYTMGVIRHKAAVIAIGTDGNSPKLARRLRKEITNWLQNHDHLW